MSLLLATAVSVALVGCSTGPEQREQTSRDIEATLEEAMRAPPQADATRELLMPPAEPEPEPLPEERFDVRVDNAPIDQFLMSLVTDSEWNLVVHPDVSGQVTLELRQVTLPEVLEVMRELHGLEYHRTGAGYIVQPARMATRIYEIDYLSLIRSGSSRTKVSSGQSTNLPPSLLDATGTAGFAGAAGAAGEDDDNASTRIQTDSESSFWQELTGALESIVGAGDGRRIISNAQAGIVSVSAMPAEHRAVAEFIEAVQGSVQRQVILEARIIEVELLDRFQSGINWETLVEIGGIDFGIGQIAGQSLFDEGTAATRGRPLDLTPGSPIGGLQSSAFGGPFSLAAGSSDFNAFIELLETQGNTRVLSSPRIATINNQKAVIKVGTDEFFVTGVQSQTAAGSASSTTASTVQLTPFFSGIALDVTPQISRDGHIILHIHPTVSSVTDQTKSFTTGGREESLPLAFSSVRESDSIIRARSGQLVVIGGLMRDEVNERRIGTPGLSGVPLLGHLFSSRQDRTSKTELVILLRPIVVDRDEVWTDQAAERLERIRSLGGANPPPGG